MTIPSTDVLSLVLLTSDALAVNYVGGTSAAIRQETALARHEAGVPQLEQDVLEELRRYLLCGREPLALHRPGGRGSQLGHRPQRVVDLG